jgi:hypothetical protein
VSHTPGASMLGGLGNRSRTERLHDARDPAAELRALLLMPTWSGRRGDHLGALIRLRRARRDIQLVCRTVADGSRRPFGHLGQRKRWSTASSASAGRWSAATSFRAKCMWYFSDQWSAKKLNSLDFDGTRTILLCMGLISRKSRSGAAGSDGGAALVIQI